MKGMKKERAAWIGQGGQLNVGGGPREGSRVMGFWLGQLSRWE